MKKNKLPIIVLLVSTMLMTACSTEVASRSRRKSSSMPDSSDIGSNNDGDNYGEGDSSQDNSSQSQNSQGDNQSQSSQGGSESQPGGQTGEVTDGLDGDVIKFLDGLDVSVPSLNECELNYTVIYYYAYSQYMIVAQRSDANGGILSACASLFEAAEGFTSLNSEYYPVEEYGYLYSDSEGMVSINFFTDTDVEN